MLPFCMIFLLVSFVFYFISNSFCHMELQLEGSRLNVHFYIRKFYYCKFCYNLKGILKLVLTYIFFSTRDEGCFFSI